VLLGFFSHTNESILGGIYLLFVHGIISSGLFLCVGSLYQRFHTRNIHYYSGLIQNMPYFSFIFFILILGNCSFPGTASFPAELLIVLGLIKSSFLITFFGIISGFFATLFSFLTFVRIVFGVSKHNFILKNKLNYVICNDYVINNFKTIKMFFYLDLNKKELVILNIFGLFTILLGIYPATFLNLFIYKYGFLNLMPIVV